jgi:cobalt transporter subunit CbtA
MMSRIFATAVLAGAIAGAAVWGAQLFKVVPLILEAEVYEQGMTPDSPALAPDPAGEQTAAEEPWAPANGIERNAYTLLTNLITGVGYALILTAIIALTGREVDWKAGLLWGMGGFAAVYALPGLGLSPEPPGAQAAALAARQTWWIVTVLSSAVGLYLLFQVKRIPFKAVGVLLIAAPQIVGAPHITAEPGAIPMELGAAYAAVSFATTLLFWLVIGGFTGHFYSRFAHR